MSAEETQSILEKYFAEANRFMDNARETLKKAGKEENQYLDVKYTKSACGIAYLGALTALDGLFLVWGVKKPKKHPSIEYYEENLAKRDRKLLNMLKDIYGVLHLDGYYRGLTSVKVIQAAFETSDDLINKLKSN